MVVSAVLDRLVGEWGLDPLPPTPLQRFWAELDSVNVAGLAGSHPPEAQAKGASLCEDCPNPVLQ